MSLSTRKGIIIGNSNLRSLNPNAVEFVPFSQRPSPGSPSAADTLSGQKSNLSDTKGKSVLHRSESSISDDEVHRYWCQQLPDDIIPDFSVMGQEEAHVTNELPFANLSLQENHDVSRFSSSSGSRFIMKDQVEQPLRSSVSSYAGDASSTNFIHFPTKSWNDTVLKNDLFSGGSLYNGISVQRRPPIALPDQATVEVPLYNMNSAQRRLPTVPPDLATVEMPIYNLSTSQRRPTNVLPDQATVEVPLFTGSSAQRQPPNVLPDQVTVEVPLFTASSAQRRPPNVLPDQATGEVPLYIGSPAQTQRRPPNALSEQATLEVPNVSPLELLAIQFPGISAENLADVYFTNGCDVSSTFDALNQRELQGDSRFPDPIFAPLEFTSLAAGSESQNGAGRYSGEETLVQPFSPYRSTSRGAVDFSSAAVRNMASRDSSIGRYDRNGSTDATVGSNNTNLFGQARGTTGDVFQVRTSPRAVASWRETGNLYSEPREDIRDHARLRNVYFEQARQAYFIGNKVLAKEMSMKGQFHNLHLKAVAHGKAQESLLRHRNNEMMMQQQGNGGRFHERIIDLQGFHANEAIHILNRELTLLKVAARTEDQRVQVYIFVGTLNQPRGSRLSLRLPIVVQRYLLEEEGLDFTEPQPGLLRVVIR